MYKVTVNSPEYGHSQYEYNTQSEALARLNRLVRAALRSDQRKNALAVTRRYTVEKIS